MSSNKDISRREFLTTSAVMGFMLSEAWRQPENESEGMQDPADILEKAETKLNEINKETIV